MIISPIFYMGNKKKLIKKGLIDLFPKNINTFVEPFGGTGIVSMNTNANTYLINDKNKFLYDLYNLFKNINSEEIIKHIEKRIEEFNLPKERTKRDVFKDGEKIEEYKKAYISFRNYANKTKNILDYYTLMFFAFSQQPRFNSKGNFNMPYGTDCFSENNKEYIKNGCKFFSQNNVKIFNNTFENLDMDIIDENDFIYLDPPYFGTLATYNENNGWNIDDEKKLYDFCEELNKRNIKFGISNMFSSKNTPNKMLIEWCNKNKWNVYDFKEMKYSACGKINENAREVFITNYEIEYNN